MKGFDEYMNLVLDEAEEVSVKRKTRKAVGMHVVQPSCPRLCCDCLYTTYLKVAVNAGRILLKGDNITLMQTT